MTTYQEVEAEAGGAYGPMTVFDRSVQALMASAPGKHLAEVAVTYSMTRQGRAEFDSKMALTAAMGHPGFHPPELLEEDHALLLRILTARGQMNDNVRAGFTPSATPRLPDETKAAPRPPSAYSVTEIFSSTPGKPWESGIFRGANGKAARTRRKAGALEVEVSANEWMSAELLYYEIKSRGG